jgi:hypothetical protein
VQGDAMNAGNDRLLRFVGVYDADGTIVGEITYFIGKIAGKTHCALCDLTHGLKLRGRDDFKRCATQLPVPIDLFHRNDQPEEFRPLTVNRLPCILAIRSDGAASIVVTAEELDACNKNVDQLERLLRAVLEADPGS